MKKFIFIIVLFFSTCVFAEGWKKLDDFYGLELYLSSGFEIISVNEFPREFSKSLAYTLVHPKGTVRVCMIFFKNWEGLDDEPTHTQCYKEKLNK